MEHLKEYVELSKKVEDLEEKVLRDIVFYLIRHHNRPEKCTLREMEREFGMPYSPLRRLMQRLVEEGVVIEGVVGNAKPYRVFDVDLAVRKGYTPEELSLKQMINVHFSALPNTIAIQGSIKGDEIYKSLPHYPLGVEDWSRVYDLLEDLRCRAMLPGEAEILKTRRKTWPVEEIEYRRKLYERMKKEIPHEEWSRIVKKYARFEDWGLFLLRTGGKPALYISFMRSNMIKPPLEKVPEHVIGEYMRNTGLPREALKPLRHLPFVDPWSLYYRDLMFELDFPNLSDLSDEEIREGLRKIAEKNLKFLLHHVKPLLEYIENRGVKGTLDAVNKSLEEGKRYKPHHILSEAIPIGFSSLFVSTVHGDEELAEQGRKIAKMIETAVVYDYKGKKSEGCTLVEFADKKGSPSGIK